MKTTIYYLDDEEALCELFEDFFEDTEYEIKTFQSPKEAIAYTLESPPQIMFFDYRLPGAKGDMIARDLPESIIKVIITGEMENNFIYNFKYILRKPCTMEEVLELIEKLVATLK